MLKHAWGWLRAGKRRWLYVWLALLALSQIVIAVFDPDPWRGDADLNGGVRTDVLVASVDASGPTGGEPVRISAVRWSPAAPIAGRVPVVMLHGSPSTGAGDYRKLGPEIAARGREAIAIESPGFGRSERWTPDYGAIAGARCVLSAMDELGIDRAHVLGWSFGGVVALEMAEIEPERLASITMLAAIGAQEAEGSGSYTFEHAKYALGYLVFVALPEAVPHFGLLGPRSARHAFIRNFWDTDQRPMRAVMERLEKPTLIFHGRKDPLVPAWAAELHHGLIRNSRLVMTPYSHFMPFRQAAETAALMAPFFERHDDPGVPPLAGEADFAPAPPRSAKVGPFDVGHTTPWWLVILFIIIGTFIVEDATVIAVGLLIAAGEIDWSVGLLGCIIGIGVGDGLLWAIGRFLGRRVLHWPVLREWLPEKALERWGRAFDTHAVKLVFIARAAPGTRLPMYIAAGILSRRAHRFLLWAALAVVVWTPILLLIAALVGPPIHKFFKEFLGGPLGLVAALVCVYLGLRALGMSFTRLGRIRLACAVRKPFRSEFWPSWVFYAPLVPYGAYLSLRHGGPMSVSCLNPGVPHGGGIVGESKRFIIGELVNGGAGEWIVPTRGVPAGPSPAERARMVDERVAADPELGGYPVAVKPDEAQRGHGFKLLHRREDAERYFEDMTRDAVIQRYHPGPHEVGVLWARRPGARADEPGEIFSITRKVFPCVEGDGSRTLEELIWSYPRLRMQAETFLKRFSDRVDRVPATGEVIRLAVAGNHCQGTMFLDGADLITPELTARIDSIARAFPGDGFDFGRFDIRYESDEALRRGERFAIVELNGTMSESTNLYDPARNILWRYRILFAQWRRMFELGGHRRRLGVRPMTPGELIRTVRDHFKGRPGSNVAD